LVICGAARPAAIPALRREFGPALRPIVRIDQGLLGDAARFARENVSATKWMARELGRSPAESRAFSAF
jgi:hypothetical protein